MGMTTKEAIEAIKCNWPDSRYTILREALDMAISALRQQEHFRDLTKKVEPLTNADRIRAMTDEELAGFLHKVGYDHRWGLKEYALDWLQQPCGGGCP